MVRNHIEQLTIKTATGDKKETNKQTKLVYLFGIPKLFSNIVNANTKTYPFDNRQ